jgi:hypothetical protein
MANTLDDLKSKLSDIISSYNSNRATILAKALKDGGVDAVNKLEQGSGAIRDAYFEILRAQLDDNNAEYSSLAQAALNETTSLQISITQLNTINEIIDNSGKVISAVGRLLTTIK